MVASMLCCVPFVNATKLDTEINLTPGASSGYVVFSDPIRQSGLAYKDGLSEGVASTADTYSEKVTEDGICARKIYQGNNMYFTADKTKFSGKKFLVMITYYDYGPDQANFRLIYTSTGGSEKTLTIRKTGMETKWKSVSFLIDDAEFSGKMKYGADLRIESGAFNAIAKFEIRDYSAFSHAGTIGVYSSSKTTDNVSKREWEYLNFGGRPAIRPYVTAQGWNYEGTKFIFSSYNTMESTDESGNKTTVANPNSFVLYEYDIVNNIVRQLDTGIYVSTDALNAVVTPDNFIYYAKADGYTWKMNWLTYEKEQTKAATYGTMNVTNDGKWISGYGGSGHLVYRQNTITGVQESLPINYAKNVWNSLNNNLNGKGHPMINPEYPHLLFFCHEGTTTIVPDRLWLANFATGDVYNMFVQAGAENNVNTQETSGHEVWSMDGEMMYWVKYTYNQNTGQSGLMRMDKHGSNREYLNGDYKFWHCFPSADHNFVVGDTNDTPTKVVIVNTNTYKPTVLASFNNESTSHPNQPHPHISYNSYSASWQFMKNGVTCIGWQVVRDITAHTVSRQVVDFGDDAEIITTSGTPSETTTYSTQGVTYRKAASGKGIYVNIKDSVCKSTNAKVKLSVSYLDNGTLPIKIIYTSGVNSRSSLAVRDDKSVTIARGNTNKLKTTTLDLGYINCNDAGKFMSDICFTTDSGETYISAVDVIYDAPIETQLAGEQISIEAKSGYADISKGLQCASSATYGDTYENTLYHVDDTDGWQAAGITQETVDAAKAKGYLYVTKQVDGAWKYSTVTDNAGSTRDAYFAPSNYRQNGSYKTISGNVYFYVTNDTVTENDNNITFTVNYLDKSDIIVTYPSSQGLSNFTIKGTGSNLWKQANVTVNDAKLSATNTKTGLATQAEDIKLESRGAEMYISGVAVSKSATDANASIYTQKIMYQGNALMGDSQKTVSTYADQSGDVLNGLQCTAYHNTPDYDNRLYHISDTQGWLEAGFTQQNIEDAISAGCEYVTSQVDGGWMYDSTTDAAGVTKDAFYVPLNYRPNSANAVNSNIYFKLVDDTITENDNEIIFVIEYLDNGSGMTLSYVSQADNGISTANISVGKTGLWKKAIIPVYDAKLSSTNNRTQLAKWVEDLRISTRGAAGMYIASVTVTKRAQSLGGAQALGDSLVSSYMEEGNVTNTIVTVKNNDSVSNRVVAYTAVFGSDGILKSVEKSDTKEIAPAGTAQITVPDVYLAIGDYYHTFVWEGNMAPVPRIRDDLKLRAAKSPDGVITLSWNDYKWDGEYFYHIIQDGKLVGRTQGGKISFENPPSGDKTYFIDVVDKYGKTLFRSNSITFE